MTTQDRISRLIFEGYESSLFEGYTVYNTEIPAAKIASEIDALQERIDNQAKKIREIDDNADFVEELRQAELKTLSETKRLLGVAHATIADLTERNASLLTSAETAQAKLAECRAEVERRDTYIAELAQKLDKLTAKG